MGREVIPTGSKTPKSSTIQKNILPSLVVPLCYDHFRSKKPKMRFLHVSRHVGLAVKKTLAFIISSFITQWQDPISPEKYIPENPLLTKNTLALLLIFILAFEQQLFDNFTIFHKTFIPKNSYCHIMDMM